MSFSLPAGGSLAIGSTYGPVVNMTAITNASPAVATLGAGHGVVVGDILEITSGWELLNNRIARVSAVATNAVTLEGIDTASLTRFPAGEGIGSIRRITAFTPITQVAEIAFSGGDQQFADTSSIFGRVETQMPTTRSPVVIEVSLHENPGLAHHAAIMAAENAGTPAALRLIGSGGARTFHNGFWGMARFATMERNATEKRAVTFTAVAEPTRYAT